MDTSIFKKTGINDFKLKPIKSDASFRKYFRVYIKNQKQNLLFVNSPKKTENNLDARAKKNTDICIPHI